MTQVSATVTLYQFRIFLKRDAFNIHLMCVLAIVIQTDIYKCNAHERQKKAAHIHQPNCKQVLKTGHPSLYPREL